MLCAVILIGCAGSNGVSKESFDFRECSEDGLPIGWSVVSYENSSSVTCEDGVVTIASDLPALPPPPWSIKADPPPASSLFQTEKAQRCRSIITALTAAICIPTAFTEQTIGKPSRWHLKRQSLRSPFGLRCDSAGIQAFPRASPGFATSPSKKATAHRFRFKSLQHALRKPKRPKRQRVPMKRYSL